MSKLSLRFGNCVVNIVPQNKRSEDPSNFIESFSPNYNLKIYVYIYSYIDIISKCDIIKKSAEYKCSAFSLSFLQYICASTQTIPGKSENDLFLSTIDTTSKQYIFT